MDNIIIVFKLFKLCKTIHFCIKFLDKNKTTDIKPLINILKMYSALCNLQTNFEIFITYTKIFIN